MAQTTAPVARDRLIDAAEQIIAEEGLAGLSTRKLLAAAGQANKSAVQYHFGSRDALIAAVFTTRAGPVDAQRREMLDALDLHGRGGELRDLAEALVGPLIDTTLRRKGSYYGRFVSHVVQDPSMYGVADTHGSTATYREVIGRLAEHSLLPPDLLEWRSTAVNLLVTSSLGYWEARGADPDAVLKHLVSACVALMSATTEQSHPISTTKGAR